MSSSYADLKNFRDNLAALDADAVEVFIEKALKHLAARLLRNVKQLTPVGVYPASSGKTGGTLRRGWKVGQVRKAGGIYFIEVYNPTEYAPYVEFGHRTRGGGGWVSGQFMLTISERQLKLNAPRILQNQLNDFVKNHLGG